LSTPDEEPRRLTRAEIMKKSIDAEKRRTGNKSYERKQLKAYTSICEILGMPTREFKKHWYGLEHPGREISDAMSEICSGEKLSRVRVYPGQLQSLGVLLSANLNETPIWKFFAKVWPECMGLPIVPFYVKGVRDPFIMTNDGGKGNNITAVLYPRIRIPVGGQSNDIYVYPLDLYIKENKREQD
jgi:hypothetical protein